MFDRRFFIGAGLAAASLPAAVQAFELEEKFKPTQVRVSAEYQPGQLLVLPRAHFLYFVTAPAKRSATASASAKPAFNSPAPPPSTSRKNGPPGAPPTK